MSGARSVLVTGATGGVGQAVVARARATGWRVHGVARQAPGAPWPSDVGVTLTDVRDADALARVTAGQGAVGRPLLPGGGPP